MKYTKDKRLAIRIDALLLNNIFSIARTCIMVNCRKRQFTKFMWLTKTGRESLLLSYMTKWIWSITFFTKLSVSSIQI